MPLINTLRADDNYQVGSGSSRDATKNKGDQTDGEKDDETDKDKYKKTETIPNPPAFYEDDMKFWN